jgi:hypothetical protein
MELIANCYYNEYLLHAKLLAKKTITCERKEREHDNNGGSVPAEEPLGVGGDPLCSDGLLEA